MGRFNLSPALQIVFGAFVIGIIMTFVSFRATDDHAVLWEAVATSGHEANSKSSTGE